jgi:hypothetical protein
MGDAGMRPQYNGPSEWASEQYIQAVDRYRPSSANLVFGCSFALCDHRCMYWYHDMYQGRAMESVSPVECNALSQQCKVKP